MKIPAARHRWNLTAGKAAALQRRLAAEVRHAPLRRTPRLVAGADCAILGDGRGIIACWVLWDAKTRSVVEQAWAVQAIRFPYVPGLLSFRETPALLVAARRLRGEPDACIIDGHGLAHPRRFGIACHVGLLLDRPTMGCAKSRLCGGYREPGDQAGRSSRLLESGETIGRVMRTREGVKPVFVSVGHRIDLAGAVRLVRQCCTRFRLPEPTRLAHQLAAEVKRTLEQEAPG